MTTTVGAYEAKTHLAQLLEQVELGGSVTITKHGRAVARLVPVDVRWTDPQDAIVQIRAARAARAGRGHGGDPIREMIDEGRR